jgi:Uma2 family endonuclease
MTLEDAARLDPDTHGGEIDRGEWVPMTRNTWRHGEVVLSVSFVLLAWARARGGYSVSVADPGTKLATNPAVLRGPDVGVVRAERRPTGRGVEGWLDGAPDLAVEVLGDDQSVSEALKKALEYLAAGAQVVWIVDPHAERLVVCTPPDHVQVLGVTDEVAHDALPGFRCTVAQLFG